MIYADNESFVGHLAVMITPERKKDADFLANSGVSTGIHYPILDHQQPAWESIFSGQGVSNAEANVGNILTLPCFPKLRSSEIEQVCEALHNLPN
jgi:dTDP-4-amino-4,6-dideoxygalactose transaminase